MLCSANGDQLLVHLHNLLGDLVPGIVLGISGRPGTHLRPQLCVAQEGVAARGVGAPAGPPWYLGSPVST